jgi:3-hydroxybutyryl-CoA dehydratase
VVNDDDFKKIPDDAVYCSTLVITEELLTNFAELSGDYNPLHVDGKFATAMGFTDRVAYGNILGLLLSRLVGMHLWSQNVMIVSQRINFNKPVYPQDTVELKAKITQKSAAVNIVELTLLFSNQAGEIVASGKCQVRSI